MTAASSVRPPRSRAQRRSCARANSSHFPTETVYGLGADARIADAVRTHLRGEGTAGRSSGDRPPRDGSATWTTGRARCPDGARQLAAAFWPGPLTLILPRAPHVDDIVTGGQDSVGLRVPSHPVARALLAAFGGGIAAPSANRFGRISPTTARHVADDLGDAVALILDGGACDVGIESTIVAFAGDEPVLLRPGVIGAAALAQVLGRAPRARRRPQPRARPVRSRRTTHRGRLRRWSSRERCTPKSPSSAERDESLRCSRARARPADFGGVWITRRRRERVRARPLREPAHARRRERRRDPHRSGAGRAEWVAVRDSASHARRRSDDRTRITCACRGLSSGRRTRARGTPRSPRLARSAGARNSGRCPRS